MTTSTPGHRADSRRKVSLDAATAARVDRLRQELAGKDATSTGVRESMLDRYGLDGGMSTTRLLSKLVEVGTEQVEEMLRGLAYAQMAREDDDASTRREMRDRALARHAERDDAVDA